MSSHFADFFPLAAMGVAILCCQRWILAIVLAHFKWIAIAAFWNIYILIAFVDWFQSRQMAVFIRLNIVWNRSKSNPRGRSVRVSLNQGRANHLNTLCTVLFFRWSTRTICTEFVYDKLARGSKRLLLFGLPQLIDFTLWEY